MTHSRPRATTTGVDDDRIGRDPAVLIATLSFALILAGRGSISIGDAAVAIVGLQQLSSRLQSAGAAFNGVHEGVTFLSDFEALQGDIAGDSRPRRPGAARPTDGALGRPSGLPIPRLDRGRPPRSASNCAAGRSWPSSAPTAPASRRWPSCCATCSADPGRSVGRCRPRHLRSLARPGADRTGVPGLRPVHAHGPASDRARRHRAARRRGGHPARGASRPAWRGHRDAAERTRHPPRKDVHRRCRPLDRPVAAAGHRPGVVPRRACRHPRRALGIARPACRGRALRSAPGALPRPDRRSSSLTGSRPCARPTS